ncbi:MAG: hypothetical protein IJT71_00590 [Oscillospiraceae bacterium]|nr:hypothetical protein [Oscillospiraceae bacterium]
MEKRTAALLLALATVFALGANAAEPAGSKPEAAAASEPAAAQTERAETPAEPEAEGALAFDALGARMRESYYPLLALEENVQTLEEWDYRRTEDELRDKINGIADQQWAYLSTVPGMGSMLSASLQPQYDAYRDAFDDVRSGKLQSDNEGVTRQLRNLQDQTVIVGESLYITLKELETQDAALSRTIDALGRSDAELTLRHELGQVSALTVQQVRAGLAQAESARATLRMNADNVLLQLKAMTGTALDGELTLAALPRVTAGQLGAMALDDDLARAKEASYELYDAQKTLDDAKKDYNDALKKYGANSKKNEWMQAKHTWQAAQYTFENALQSYELKFRALYAQVKDASQAADAKRAALAGKEAEYAASALKYEQGNLSANALADAKDALAEAKDAALGAERELFSQYRSYCWAVEYGILNG